MKKRCLTLFMLCAFSVIGFAQKVAVKTNVAEWATLSPNLGVEVSLFPCWTLDVDGLYSPLEFRDQKKTKIWAVQPELRYWFCSKFNGHFIGLHGQYAEYDYGLNHYNYNGWLAGAGLSYGYSLPLSFRWKLEANIGIGWNRVDCERTARMRYPGDIIFYDPLKKDYFGITRAGISFIYVIH